MTVLSAIQSVRCVGPCDANVSAPEEASSSQPSFGAAVFSSDGDLVDLPRFARAAVNRFAIDLPPSDAQGGGGNPAVPAQGAGPP